MHFHCNINIKKNMFNYSTCIQVNYTCMFGKFRLDSSFLYMEFITIVFV